MTIRRWWPIILTVLGMAVCAQAKVVDVANLRHVDLTNQIALLEDAGGRLELDQVRKATGFAPPPNGRTSLGFTQSVWWVKANLDNPGDGTVETILRQDYPLIDEIEMWAVRDGTIIDHVATGDRHPFAQRPLAHRDFLFPLALPAHSTTTVYLRMQTDGALNIGLSLYAPNTLIERLSEEQLAFGLYFGGFFVLIAYNLFIFLAIRDRPFLYYLLYATSYGLYFTIHDGFSFQFLWPDQPNWANTSLLVMLSLTLMFGMKFTRSFLDSSRLAPKMDKFALVLQSLAVAALCASFFVAYQRLIVPVAYLTIAITMTILALGIVGLLRRIVSARYFMIAWSVLLLGVLVYMAKTFGLLPHNAVTQNAFQIGSLLEMVLLSLALAHRVRELSDLSRTDPLTKLLNRRSFDEILEREFERGRRGITPVALLVADIDHFKRVNDRFGHDTGDKVLRQVAGLLQDQVDGRDIVGRYGGEEFAILLPGLDLEAAAERAERLRDMVQARAAAPVPTTISIGVASTADAGLQSPNALFRAADDALYEAKRLGRNRVATAPPHALAGSPGLA